MEFDWLNGGGVVWGWGRRWESKHWKLVLC